MRLRLALYKVRTAQQDLPLQRLLAPEGAIRDDAAPASSISLETMTPRQLATNARARVVVVVTGSAPRVKDPGLLLLLPTPPRSGERTEEAAAVHRFHQQPVMHNLYAQSQLRTHVQDSTHLALAAQTSTPKATPNPTVMLSTPTSIKAAKGLLQLGTI
ncbi:hypothetical protein D0Z00_003356 [Geotrichum galactomycetum]|uniref:Uncharacterized protein n=1 Tax=Geotrichum galactomycetum TaxID=27317 RepID=A0ACB6V1I6_9ASCO|nr:hypothetical protein D0Z00_003356 [Geotrichum candidum]